MTTVHPYIHLQTKVNAKKYNNKYKSTKDACTSTKLCIRWYLLGVCTL